MCELFGIPIYLDSSLIVLLILFATSGGSLMSGLLGAVLLLFSITAHELGHSLAARGFGYETNDITLSLLGGCASLIAMPRKALQEFLTAIAGPAVSFALGILALGVASLLVVGNVWSAALFFVTNGGLGHADLSCSRGLFWIVDLLIDMGLMNFMLGGFNLLPGFPMDGGRIFRSAMRAFMSRSRATFVAMVVGRVFAVLLALNGLHRVMNHGNWGFVTILIAWMIWREGYREYRQAVAEESWQDQWDYSARVSPPPYGGDGDETEIRRGR
ncbi:MAG: site-2 protease family protein [Kiritimatiellia bacterium]